MIDSNELHLSAEELRLCVRVAKLYYENDLTQDEIGKRLGYSRVKINRVLSQARAAGIVVVSINTQGNDFLDLETRLVTRYGLRDAFVVPDEPPGAERYLSLARGAAAWLLPRLEPGQRIGLGLGRTISYLPQVFRPERQVDCIFTEVVGAASDHSGGIASYNVTSKMADLVGGRAEVFYAPTYVSNPELREKLLAEPSIASALQRARSANIILQSVGPVDDSALLYVHNYITRQELDMLCQRGAVGDALGHYFDASGAPVLSNTDRQIIGIELDDLKKIPWSVLVGGGPEKVLPIAAGLRGKYFNVLVTDRQTAASLLD
jgi:DNA-binding transcriptional regulator LsrR (DeoR family)